MAQSRFASVFVDSAEKDISLDEETTNSAYNCGSCRFSGESLYALVLHESQMHFIEFSRIVTKLKTLIDEFLVPEDTNDVKFFKREESPEHFDQIEYIEDVEDISEETEIIRRLQESAQVSFKVSKPLVISSEPPRSLRKELALKINKDKITFKSITSGRRGTTKPFLSKFTCTFCTESFDKLTLLQQHERSTHKYTCHYCGRQYTVKLNLKMHLFREHKGVKTYCVECGLSTTDLKEHMKKHENDPTYICDICGKEMRGRQKINNHMNRTHKELFARFFCKYCDAGFKYMADLTEHMIKHEPNRKDHKCNLCEKAYKRKNELKRHMQSHTGQKWRCEDCGREYAWQRGLWSHKTKGGCKKGE